MSDIISTGNKRDKWTLRVTELLNWLNDNKSAVLTEGNNITLTPQADGTIRISAEGGGGDVTDVQLDGTSIIDQDGVANIETMTGATSQTNGTKGLVPQPLTTDKDKFLKGDGTWDEAGGGNVDDVVMNGQSIVDANKVANFNNYVELTRAEWEALPNSKYTDNILYCIKDSGSEKAEFFYPIIYSLAEREVGVWIDGKPLYQKSVKIENVSWERISNYYEYIYSLQGVINNIENVYAFGYEKRQSGTVVPLHYNRSDTGDSTSFVIRPQLNDIYFISHENLSAYIFITLQYTKTTDNPGTGKWTTSGVPAHHYSTDEQVIGTWMGETLYEKTYHYTGTLNSNAWVTLDSSRLPSNTPYFSVKDVCFISTEISSSAKMSAYAQRLPFDIVISNGEQLYLENKSSYKIYEFVVTIQYTKSS